MDEMVDQEFVIVDPKEQLRESRTQLRSDLKSLKNDYGLKVEMGRLTDSDDEDVSLTKLSLPEAVEAVKLLKGEIQKYPTEYLRNCQVNRFRLVKELKVMEDSGKQRSVRGLHIRDSGNLYIKAGSKEAIHHELFHRADLVHWYKVLRTEGKSLAEQARDRFSYARGRVRELNWRLLHPWGTYLHNGYEALTEDQKAGVFKGFAGSHAMVNDAEDRAVTAELLMTNPTEALQRRGNDPILRKKLNRVAGFYFDMSSGRMNQQYFQDLSQGQIGLGYWNKPS